MTRIRDFGTRRANRLVESYESQLNKMKTFTLQHRLKLMRQYKLKQHQINKLLENIANNENPSSNHHDQVRNLNVCCLINELFRKLFMIFWTCTTLNWSINRILDHTLLHSIHFLI